ncbi:MAG: AMP-binding protein, partial [Pirellulales bacterium]|nr:AMP-binding protein [Pirellulales bacterium]
VGLATSLRIARLKPANPRRAFPLNCAWQVVQDLRTLGSDRALLRAALGTMFFWSLAALAQMNVDLFAISELHVNQDRVGPLLGVLALGVGLGSVLAGLWSNGRVELGIVPLGAAALAASSILLFGVPSPLAGSLPIAYGWTCLFLFCLGIGAGLFAVPLEAFLQERSPEKSRGVVLAAANFLTFSGMLLSAGLFWVLRDAWELSARQIFLVAGLATLPVFLYVVWLLPGATLRFLVWLASRTVYRVRIEGIDNLPQRGGALLVANHVSWIDGILLLLSSSRPVRMVAHADYVEGWWIRGLARRMGAIPIDASRKSMVRAIRTAREALADGDLVCIFPEGKLTRTGHMQPFRPGFLSILKGTGAPLIPVYLHGLWGSIFSFERGKFFWKWPRRWPYPISICFGTPLKEVTTTHEIRQKVELLGTEAMRNDESSRMIPARHFLRNCRRAMRQPKAADSTGAQLTAAGVLTRALIFRRLLLRDILAEDEPHVGLLIPPTVAGVVANVATTLAGRIPINLNYAVRSSDVLNNCIARAGIRHVLTSRKVMEKLDLTIDAEIVFLEDLAAKVTWIDKLAGAWQAWLTPIPVLERRLGLTKIDPDDLATIVFTSGSTGIPKGVMLTHRNIVSNVVAFTTTFHIVKEDVLIGILPFFHAFGYTVTLWAPLMLEPSGIYHPNPLEPRPVGKLCKKYGGTILVATPTFLRSYLRRVEPEDFATLNLVVLGAEKMPLELATAFEKQFGVRPIEGYGTTELSPAVAANVPKSRLGDTNQLALKEGSIGKPLPGISARVVDLDTGEDLEPNHNGMLLVTGPNVMKGYLDEPEKTAKVMRDGWYVTGDVARIDEDGFIFITGRLNRFAKIGGEMVPHLGVEEAIVRMLGLDEEEVRVVVTSVPDERKGERLVVLHTGLEKSPDEICRALAGAGLPPIWIPSPENFRQVNEIPLLGSGKLALKEVNDVARRLFGAA